MAKITKTINFDIDQIEPYFPVIRIFAALLMGLLFGSFAIKFLFCSAFLIFIILCNRSSVEKILNAIND